MYAHQLPAHVMYAMEAAFHAGVGFRIQLLCFQPQGTKDGYIAASWVEGGVVVCTKAAEAALACHAPEPMLRQAASLCAGMMDSPGSGSSPSASMHGDARARRPFGSFEGALQDEVRTSYSCAGLSKILI